MRQLKSYMMIMVTLIVYIDHMKILFQDCEILKYIGCRKICDTTAYSLYNYWQTCVPLFLEENCHFHCHFHLFSIRKSHFSAGK